MAKRIAVLFFLIQFISNVSAENLPTMSKHPWFGCFVGFDQRRYDVAIRSRGNVEVFLKDRGKRTGSPKIKMQPILLETQLSGSKVKRNFRKNTFSTKSKSELNPDEVSYEVSATMDVRVKIAYRWNKDNGLEFSGIILDRGKAKGDLELIFELKTSDFYRLDNGDPIREWKKSTKGDSLTVYRVDGKVLRSKLVNSPEMRLIPFLDQSPCSRMVFATRGLQGLKMECGVVSYTSKHVASGFNLDFLGKKHLTDTFLVRFKPNLEQKYYGYLKLR